MCYFLLICLFLQLLLNHCCTDKYENILITCECDIYFSNYDQTLPCPENVNDDGLFFKFLFVIKRCVPYSVPRLFGKRETNKMTVEYHEIRG